MINAVKGQQYTPLSQTSTSLNRGLV